MNKWQAVIHNCDFILVRKEISDAFEHWQREAASEGGEYYMHPDLAKVWTAFAANPTAETAAELLEVSPELASYFEACQPGGVYYEAASLENGATHRQGNNPSAREMEMSEHRWGHPLLRVFDWYVLKPLWFVYVVLALLYFLQGYWGISIFLVVMWLLVSVAGQRLYAREISGKEMAAGTPKIDWTARRMWGEMTFSENRRFTSAAWLSGLNLGTVVAVLAVHSELRWYVVIGAALVVVGIFRIISVAMVRGLVGVAGSDSAAEIAENIYRSFVEGLKVQAPEDYGIPTHLKALFSTKVRLYREAIILIVLRTKAEKDKRYEKLLRGFEVIVFPKGADDVGMTKLQAIQAAMKNIGELLPSQAGPQKSHRSESKIMSWSHDWLKSVGHEETNPVVLAKFALVWQEVIINVNDAIEEIGRLF